MKRFVTGALFAVLASQANAVVIDTAGSYIFDTTVDEIVVDSSLSTEDVMIQIVSGGVVQNNVVCSNGAQNCDFRVTVSGNGTVMGRVLGEGAQINIRDDAQVGVAGAQSNDGGRVMVSGNAHVGTITGAGSGILGAFEIDGGIIDHVASTPQTVVMSMNGGVINSGFSAWGLSLNLRGGEILGNVQSDVLDLRLRMSGGHIAGDLVAVDEMFGVIGGGSIDGDLRALFGGVLDIYGGQFGGGDPSSLWRLGGTQVMNVYGWDLMLNDSRLTGFLLDGSRLDINISRSQSFTGALNLINVPEPGTLALFGVGLLGAFVARRKGKIARE